MGLRPVLIPLRSWGGWGTGQPSQTFLLHSWGHALLPPCLRLVINYFRLAKSGQLGSYNPPAMSRGQSPGQETHSTHRVQRVLVNWDRDNRTTSWATNHTAVGKQKAGPSHSMEQHPWSTTSQNCVEGREGATRTGQHTLGLRAFRKIRLCPSISLVSPHQGSPCQGPVPRSRCTEDKRDPIALSVPTGPLTSCDCSHLHPHSLL